eukprot:62087-Chlamydomonas_euryale.AAC.2
MKAASSLGMQCLIEVHTIAELERVLQLPDVERHILGINNRDLGTFQGLCDALGINNRDLPWTYQLCVNLGLETPDVPEMAGVLSGFGGVDFKVGKRKMGGHMALGGWGGLGWPPDWSLLRGFALSCKSCSAMLRP